MNSSAESAGALDRRCGRVSGWLGARRSSADVADARARWSLFAVDLLFTGHGADDSTVNPRHLVTLTVGGDVSSKITYHQPLQ